MIRKFFPVFILFSFFTYAQVGINTNMPNATLEVVGKPAVSTSMDGIIPPNITGDQLRLKTYSALQTGAVVYVTAADSAPAGQTTAVTTPGYYFFSGSRWVKLISSDDRKIRTLSSGTVAADDFTILVTGNISLPAPNASNTSRIYNLINETAGSVTVSGTFRINGGNFTNYVLNNSDLGRGIVVQSNGSAWVLISRY
ncbi:hypothetical protein [Chryseobacterium salviniae]|uniref:Uncharacterized protein n=1 Tax=Chryseobacterium salviniae TaxID=3101750 RepID=A0ABU6HUF6_9FLAO|nr:hypothetical protein [Chryseobacterium sp. T9W2-O]MEC3876699.1 hypothetical protein [Chryseobacterium sp. T9W2-O]